MELVANIQYIYIINWQATITNSTKDDGFQPHCEAVADRVYNQPQLTSLLIIQVNHQFGQLALVTW